MEVSAKQGKDGPSMTVKYDFGTDLDAAAKKFKPEVVFANFTAAAVVSLQSYMRGLIKQGKKQDEVQELVKKWKPGVRTPGKSAAEKARESLAALSPEDRAKILADLAKMA